MQHVGSPGGAMQHAGSPGGASGVLQRPRASSEAPATVYAALQASLNADDAIRGPAEQLLVSLESAPGQCTILLQIIARQELDTNARWMAACCLKNIVTRHWVRRRADTLSLEDSEKQRVRDGLLRLLDEQANAVALQVAVTIAQIARHDAAMWPELFRTLLAAIQNGGLPAFRGLHALQSVCKELASKRLARDKHAFRQLAPQILDVILPHWLAALAEAENAGATGPLGLSARTLASSTKLVSVLVVYGFEQLPSEGSVPQFFHTALMQMRAGLAEIAQARRADGQGDDAEDIENDDEGPRWRRAVVRRLLRAVSMTQQSFVESFAQFVYPFAELLLDAIRAGTLPRMSGAGPACEFLSSVLCYHYVAEPVQAGEVNSSDSPRRGQILGPLARLLTTETLGGLCSSLVTNYLVLPPKMLAAWAGDDDDEDCDREWAAQQLLYPSSGEDTEAGEEGGARSGAEELLCCLLDRFGAELRPVAQEIAQLAHSPGAAESRPGDPAAALRATVLREACMFAVGVAPTAFQLDFSAWFASGPAQELVNPPVHAGAVHGIVRARIVWLLGAYVQMLVAESATWAVQLCEAALHDPDLVVRLSASKALEYFLCECRRADEWVLGRAETLLAALIALWADVAREPARLQVLRALSALVVHCGQRARQYAVPLLGQLQAVWATPQLQDLCRASVVSTLTALVRGVGVVGVVPGLLDFSTAVVRASVDPSHSAAFLLDDALDLWRALLQHSGEWCEALDNLWALAGPQLVGDAGSALSAVGSIWVASLVLGGSSFVGRHGPQTVAAFVATLPGLGENGIHVVCEGLHVLLAVHPAAGLPLVAELLVRMLERILTDNERSKVESAAIIGVLARVLFQEPQWFFELLESLASERRVLRALLALWFENFDMDVLSKRLRTCGIAAAQLLIAPAHVPAVMLREFVTPLLSVMIRAALQGQPKPPKSTNGDTPGAERFRQVWSQDPVVLADPRQICAAALRQARAAHGDAAYEHLLEAADPVILQQVRELLAT